MTECVRCGRDSVENERMELCAVCENWVRETVRDYVAEHHNGNMLRSTDLVHVCGEDGVLCEATMPKNEWRDADLGTHPFGWPKWCRRCLDHADILSCDFGGKS